MCSLGFKDESFVMFPDWTERLQERKMMSFIFILGNSCLRIDNSVYFLSWLEIFGSYERVPNT